MTSPQATVEKVAHDSEAAGVREGRASRPRRLIAGVLLSVCVTAALAAGAWGLLSPQVSPAAGLGETVEVPGGLLRVESVAPEQMEHAQTDGFAQSGMQMSSMGVDMAPEGQGRFSVEVALAAGDAGLSYSPEDFLLAGEGVKETAPIRSQLGDGVIPAGSETSGLLVFQAPEKAEGLTLSFDGGASVAIDPGSASGSGGSHGGHSEADGSPEGQPDGHEH
ncbi:MAG: hypothetical protein H0V53_06665 [Rubrobacter sp.]|nr:hypothetical protein [Rubrobacter sp.]